MRRRIAAFLVLWLGTSAANPAPPPPAVAQVASSLEVIAERFPDVGDVFGDSLWVEHLVNPVCTSPAEVRAMLGRCRALVGLVAQIDRARARGLDDLPPELPSELVRLRQLAQAFVDYVGPDASVPSGADLVDLTVSADPAVDKLRTVLGIAPPRGYIFVRRYPDWGRVPAPMREFLQDDDRAAATVFCRYVVVIDNPFSPRGEEATGEFLQRFPAHDGMVDHEARASAPTPEVLRRTLSHELVHAYLNASLGFEAGLRLPRWFHEGCAITLSGSGKTVAKYVPSAAGGGRTVFTETEEYREYRQVFELIRKRIGARSFDAALGDAIATGDASRLLAAARFRSYDEAVAALGDWRRYRELIFLAATALVAFGFLWLKHALREREPPPEEEAGAEAEAAVEPETEPPSSS